MQEHKEFVRDLVSYFKKTSALDNEWQEKGVTLPDNESDKNGNGGHYPS